MMRISEIFTAGQTKTFSVPGNYFRIKSLTGVTSGSISVSFYMNGKPLTLDLKDVDAGDYARVPQGFDSFDVTSAEAQTVETQVSRGEVGSDRITGDVSVIDGGKNRTLSNEAFVVAVPLDPVAGNYNAVQCWNPVGSGKNVFIEAVTIATHTAQQVFVGINATQLTVSTTGFSKKGGGAASSAKACFIAAATVTTTDMMMIAEMPAPGTYRYSLTEPIMLPEGYGLVIASQIVNADLSGTFEFIEEPA